MSRFPLFLIALGLLALLLAQGQPAHGDETFTISAQAGAHGTITPSGLVTVPEGGDQTFTMTPDANHHVADVFVRSWLPSQIVEVPAVVRSYESGCTSVFRLTGEFAGATFTFGGVNYTIGLDESRPFFLALIANDTRVGSVTVSQMGGSTFITVMPDNAPSFTVAFNELGCVISGRVFEAISEPTFGVVRVVEGVVVGSSVGAVTTYTFSNVTANHSIDASFAIDTHTLTVIKGGTGTGTVLSFPSTPGIDCGSGSGCAAQYNHGTVVELIALPDDGSTFTGWSDACTDTGICVVMMDGDRNVTATFMTPRTYTNTATAGANGTIAPSGSLTVEHGATQTFTITPDPGFRVADVLVGTLQTPTLETVNLILTLYESECSKLVSRATGEFAGASFTFGGVNYVIGLDPSTEELALFVGGTRVGSISVQQMEGSTFITVMPDNAPSFTVAFNELGCVISGTVFEAVSESETFVLPEQTVSSAGAVSSYTFSNVIANHTIHATFEVDPDSDGDGVPDSADACPTTPDIFGTAGPDLLVGTAGPDCIHGLAGNDLIFGLGGNDTIRGGPGKDGIAAGAGNDTVFGEDGADVLLGQSGDDALDGGSAFDSCAGGSGVDTAVSCEAVAGIP